VTSTTPLQALYLMNDPFVHLQARKFAARLLVERPDDASRIDQVYQLLLARPATIEEESAARAYLSQARGRLGTLARAEARQTAEAWESLVRVLFLSNELVYVP